MANGRLGNAPRLVNGLENSPQIACDVRKVSLDQGILSKDRYRASRFATRTSQIGRLEK